MHRFWNSLHAAQRALCQAGGDSLTSGCATLPVRLQLLQHLAHHMHVQAERMEGRLLINPGSATGACSVFNNDVVPSFVLMDINGSKVSSICSGRLQFFLQHIAAATQCSC